jgi:hypothetical protein
MLSRTIAPLLTVFDRPENVTRTVLGRPPQYGGVGGQNEQPETNISKST